MPESPVIVMQTNQGVIELKLFPDTAPESCENFIRLSEKGYYDGVLFHRVIKNFMIQGGDPTGTGYSGQSIWGKPFDDEVTPELKFNKPGILAMANSGKNTNSSQFFITTVQTPWLNMHHSIFGEVIKGYEVVRKIELTITDSANKPVEEQKIIKMRLKKNNLNDKKQ